MSCDTAKLIAKVQKLRDAIEAEIPTYRKGNNRVMERGRKPAIKYTKKTRDVRNRINRYLGKIEQDLVELGIKLKCVEPAGGGRSKSSKRRRGNWA